MKKETAIKRLLKSSLTTKKNTLNKYYVAALIDLCLYPTGRHQLKWWVGYGTALKDRTSRYIDVLDVLHIPYVWSNDAPRGGQEGWYVRITPSGCKALKEYAKYVRHIFKTCEYRKLPELLVTL